MSDMHEIILDSTNKIFKDLCTKELIDQAEGGKFAEEVWEVLVESGITLVGVPESAGGTGGDYDDAFHILQTAGRFGVPLPLAETLIVQWVLADHGVNATNEVLTVADGASTSNTIELEETSMGYSIKGKAINVPWARDAKKVLSLAKLAGKSVIALLPLNKAIIKNGSNLAGEPSDIVIFDKVTEEGIFVKQVDEIAFNRKINELGGLAKAAMMSGAMETVLELSVTYVKEREQFGRPLHRLQAIQQHLAVLSGETVASISITNQAIAAFDKGIFDHEIAAAKLKVNESSGIITELAHQLHGAIGVTHEHQLHQMTRRLWAWRDEFGNENYWADQLAEKVMNMDNQNLWAIITDKQVEEIV